MELVGGSNDHRINRRIGQQRFMRGVGRNSVLCRKATRSATPANCYQAATSHMAGKSLSIGESHIARTDDPNAQRIGGAARMVVGRIHRR